MESDFCSCRRKGWRHAKKVVYANRKSTNELKMDQLVVRVKPTGYVEHGLREFPYITLLNHVYASIEAG